MVSRRVTRVTAVSPRVTVSHRCHGVTEVSTWCHGRVTRCHAGVTSMSHGVTAVSQGVAECREV